MYGVPDVFGTSKIITAIPTARTFRPSRGMWPRTRTRASSIPGLFPQVITVGNYYNQQQYTDVSGVPRDLGGISGAISVNSSHGPSRTGVVKPDVAAPG